MEFTAFPTIGAPRGALSRFAFVLLFTFLNCSASRTSADSKSNLESACIQFFLDNANPMTGLVRDNAENFRPTPTSNNVASIASTGFGLAVVSNAAMRGLVGHTRAEAYVLKTLRYASKSVSRQHGWFLHFVNWETGKRIDKSEYSTIDTALFLAGALYASQVFSGNQEIKSLAHSLYAETDFWDVMTDGGTKSEKRTLSMAWTPEHGYTDGQWNMYAEQKLLLLLGLGHPTTPLPPEVWSYFDRDMNYPRSGGIEMGLDEALFIHQYSELYVDFRQFHDQYPNYFDNSKVISEIHRNNGSQGFWGFSAGEAPDNTYAVWSAEHHSSIYCIGCAIGSAMFMPSDVLADISAWANGPYRKQIWGKYGFVDSLDLTKNWYSNLVLGITVGPEYLSLANINEATSIWKVFMSIPEIQAGILRATGH